MRAVMQHTSRDALGCRIPLVPCSVCGGSAAARGQAAGPPGRLRGLAGSGIGPLACAEGQRWERRVSCSGMH